MKGTIWKRQGKRGVSYTARVDLGPDPVSGKRRQRAETFRTRKEAEAELAKWIADIERGTAVDAARISLGEYLTGWLDSLREGVGPATRRRYNDLLRRHVIPHVGHVPMAKLAPQHVRQLQSDRLDAGLSSTTVAFLHATLHRALKDAEVDGLIPRNVAKHVRPPRRVRPEYKTWTAQQAAAFLAAAEEDDYAALWRLALLTGMRRGEILGLRWEDVDLDKGALAVRRTLSRGATARYEPHAPKTASGRRSVALQGSAVEALRRHRTAQLEHRLLVGAAYQDQGYVFTTPEGRPLHPNTVALHFSRVSDRAGLPRLRFHDLRHTSATLMLANGEHPKKVQERLGHANISITLDRYSHVTMDMQREAAERLDALLKAAGDGP
jgi:integrase